MATTTPDNPQPIIEVEGLYKCYWAGKVLQPALNGVYCSIRKGAFVVLAGRSGSGKSTLLNIIGGLELPDGGSVHICGENILQRSKDQRARFRLRHVGIVFQAYNLIQVLSARENVAYVCRLQGHSRAQCHQIADRWLEEVELVDLGYRRPEQLSGGQQQRVAIARALAMNPEIVLADEPTANLDSKTADRLIALMRRLNRKFGTTFVIASHDQVLIDSADRIVNMEDGKIVVDGKPVAPQAIPAPTPCPEQKPTFGKKLSRWFARARKTGN